MASIDSGNVYLVAGASGGLTEGVALGLVSAGARVHVLGRDRGRLQAWVERIGEERVHVGDPAEPGHAARVVGEVLAAEGRLDGLVYGAGPYAALRLDETGPDVWQHLWRGNVMGALALVDAARASLRASDGSILLFGAAGLEGLRARSTCAAYTSIKTALLSYMVSLAREEAEFGVRVNMISPGIVPHDGAAEDTLDPERWQQIPMGRPGTIEDIQRAALWLLSSEAAHVTGQNLEVAGGFLL
ncbi:MAG: SDR family oxidoreductase [Planctomycetes bacterium]|nr:SDR family oxidoreductase [Planctomycetota bacterium]